MLGKTLENVFIKIWVIIKLNLIFWLFSFSGLLVFGIGPALKTINELFINYKFNDKEITLNTSWSIYKKNLLRGNSLFYTFLLASSFIIYNLFLSVQIQRLSFLIINFLLLFALLFIFTIFQYTLLLDSYYEISFCLLLKLAIISTFANFSAFFKLILGTGIIFFITWRYKGFILFCSIAMIQIWSYYATKKWRMLINERLGIYE
ncbi:YesL family protein [Melissococcus plutonius]|uniref:DUF624 domain-containing protein n=1 Tax=Melissococcus plutonius (strain ATCC 35311 / DSM 29964 / CIP 104052 / LMG 20360 / NCIMB 702443) TaxID=940190 RepID=F3Y8Z8_MELPT|nr:DUF624 domain-containing protein [Melissococcus plutonius]AIM24589.1 putative integral membrane protein [Melissococcus plutonius S1]KMT24671.1 putative integral membrane protein [Melissococcus plutonius]KMT27384.1 putative integral membrane protein [Melissococcus plutonius]KMT27557.1 putative integral membrane protein [Melissococcus plutonius]KMT29331.1 putative integral membrane protein [Melissococcus plutonius]